jgi:hypothetical protein
MEHDRKNPEFSPTDGDIQSPAMAIGSSGYFGILKLRLHGLGRSYCAP